MREVTPFYIFVHINFNIMSIPSVITVSLVESSVDVAENDSSTQLCVNITHGNVESSAYVGYSTRSGTATCTLFTNHIT
jgi:hypothetical protein